MTVEKRGHCGTEAILRFREIDVRTCGNQYASGFDRSFPRCEEQRGEPAFAAIHESAAAGHADLSEIELPGTRIDLGAVVDQKLHHFGMVFGCSEHQRSLAAKFFGAVDLRIVFEKEFHRFDLTGTS